MRYIVTYIYGTIPSDGSHFPVRNETSRASDDKTCELDPWGWKCRSWFGLHLMYLYVHIAS